MKRDIYNGLCIIQELKIGKELTHDRKYDFEGYRDEAEVGENSSSSNVPQNKESYCKKVDKSEKLSSTSR